MPSTPLVVVSNEMVTQKARQINSISTLLLENLAGVPLVPNLSFLLYHRPTDLLALDHQTMAGHENADAFATFARIAYILQGWRTKTFSSTKYSKVSFSKL